MLQVIVYLYREIFANASERYVMQESYSLHSL